MSEIFYGIPTYKRVDAQITLNFLHSIGIDKQHIILATQLEDEFERCKELYSDICTVIYREGVHNLSGNRNTIIEYLPIGTNVLILDDDIEGFEINVNGKLQKLSGKHFITIVERMFFLAREYNSKLWSVYPVENAYFMEKTPIIKFNRPVICVHGLITSDLRYDEEQTVKEDYMFVCDNFAKGYPTLRLENVTSNAKHWTNKGGCKDQWGTNAECMERVLKKYPQYVVKNPKREGEILLKNNIKIGNVQKVGLF